MSDTIRIEVTAEDIARGVRASDSASPEELSTKCPVALAMTRTLSFPWAVSYHGAWPYLTPDGVSHPATMLPLPDEVIRWIEDYDWGDETPEPFAFEVER